VHALTSYITEDKDLFLLAHMGLAAIDPLEWKLEVNGMVMKPASFSLADLQAMPQYEVTSVHECAGSGRVRLVVPGWYGTNSVKWLGGLTVTDHRAPGPYTTRFYNDPSPNGSKPVWGIPPESIIVSPFSDHAPSQLFLVERGCRIHLSGTSSRDVGRE
jgi:DMSO/TMAO reductase YedYZ molybdopterin-dependent catalytic subunit